MYPCIEEERPWGFLIQPKDGETVESLITYMRNNFRSVFKYGEYISDTCYTWRNNNGKRFVFVPSDRTPQSTMSITGGKIQTISSLLKRTVGYGKINQRQKQVEIMFVMQYYNSYYSPGNVKLISIIEGIEGCG